MNVQNPTLSQDEVLRYSRHLMLPEVGLEGQRKLKGASVLIVGSGGLGSPVALYLAAAGIGHIGIVDYDAVDSSNLQRQVLFGESSVGQRKVRAACNRLHDLNSLIQVDPIDSLFTSKNAMAISEGYDILVDCSDNFPTRYLVNDLCVLTGRPDVYGSVFRFEGHVSVFDSRLGPCYRCMFPKPPQTGLIPTCAEGGVFGVVPGTIGTLQATEVIKLILGASNSLIGRILIYDSLEQSVHPIRIKKNPQCEICGEVKTITQLVDYEIFCNDFIGHNRQTDLSDQMTISPAKLKERLQHSEKVTLLDVRESVEHQVSGLPGAINIPLGLLGTRMKELDQNKEIVVFCRTGSRSASAVQILRAAGFQHCRNLAGGLNAWAEQIEPEMLRY